LRSLDHAEGFNRDQSRLGSYADFLKAHHSRHSPNHWVNALIKGIADLTYDQHSPLVYFDFKCMRMVLTVASYFGSNPSLEHGVRNLLLGSRDLLTHLMDQPPSTIPKVAHQILKVTSGSMVAFSKLIEEEGASPVPLLRVEEIHGQGTE
jgi:hypothetical protein